MGKVLLTGGSGFIAAHVLDLLLQRGHEVVTTVRSEEKASQIRAAHPGAKLTVVIVPDIAAPDAFDDVVSQTPGLDYVQHTASPFHYSFTDPKTEVLDPAINGTNALLRAVQRHAPSVRRVVVTSSFAAILSDAGLRDPSKTFSEADWNPVTYEDGLRGSKVDTYRASKTLAERAAWDFVARRDEEGKGTAPGGFDLATICPPLVTGPVAHHLGSLAAINTSNARFVDAASGKWAAEGAIPPTGVFFWVDVRDAARAHVEAMERPAAGGRRFFVVGGRFSNREIVEHARAHFPDLRARLPGPEVPGGGYPEAEGGDGAGPAVPGFDNARATRELGIEWTPFEKSVVDTLRSLQEVGGLGGA